MSAPSVRLEHVAKRFMIPHTQRTTLRVVKALLRREALRHELDLNARGAVGQARMEAEQIVAAAEERAAAIDAMTKVKVERRLQEQREALAKQAADLEVVARARIAELKDTAAAMGDEASEGAEGADAGREEHP